MLDVYGKLSIFGKTKMIDDSNVGTYLTEKELELWKEVEDNREIQEGVVEGALLKAKEEERTKDAPSVSAIGAQSTPVHDLEYNEGDVEAVEAIPSVSFVMDAFGRLEEL